MPLKYETWRVWEASDGENGGYGYGGSIFGNGSTAMSWNAVDECI